VFAVQCPECGATGPVSLSGDPSHAVSAWNQRQGRTESRYSRPKSLWASRHAAQPHSPLQYSLHVNVHVQGVPGVTITV
jgi:hypothetical protein